LRCGQFTSHSVRAAADWLIPFDPGVCPPLWHGRRTYAKGKARSFDSRTRTHQSRRGSDARSGGRVALGYSGTSKQRFGCAHGGVEAIVRGRIATRVNAVDKGMTILRIANGRIIDPSQRIDQVADLWIEGERIIDIGPHPHQKADRTIDAAGKIVCPGLIDMHVHLREPGREEDETIATGTAAALAGGVTSVACMPNTEPPIDSQAAAEFVRMQAMRAGHANVFPIGTISKNREGKELAEIGGLVEGGAVAFTDDGSPVVSSELMRRALEYAKMFDKAILSHSEDLELTRGGVMHEGFESVKLGLRGMPAAAEEIMVYRE